jgi:O-antigen ligase
MQVLLGLLVLFLPFGTRKIFGHAGLPHHEWNALFISLGDILIVLLLGLAVINFLLGSRRRSINVRTIFGSFQALAALFLFLLAIGVSVFWHGFELLSVFRYFKILLAVGFAMLIARAFREGKGEILLRLFLIAVLFQSILATGQFFGQRDFNLQILGESPLDSYASGIAKIDIGGMKIIRAYGTLPHPNVLAAYAVIAVFGVLALALRRRLDSWWMAAIFPLMLSLFVSFSRSAFLAFMVGLLVVLWYSWRYRKTISKEAQDLIITFFITIGASVFIYSALFFPFLKPRIIPERTEGAIVERVYYADIALKMIKQNPIFGIGWGKFSDLLPQYVENRPITIPSRSFPLWLLQPVHNIYLLIAAEAGIGALLAFLFFVAYLLRGSCRPGDIATIPLRAGLIAMLIMGFFDHFLFTVGQGILLFWFLIGIVMAGNKREVQDGKRPVPLSGI